MNYRWIVLLSVPMECVCNGVEYESEEVQQWQEDCSICGKWLYYPGELERGRRMSHGFEVSQVVCRVSVLSGVLFNEFTHRAMTIAVET